MSRPPIATTHGRTLDRLVQFDVKSRAFGIRARLEPKPMRSYTWSAATSLDQGAEGACVGFGWSHELLARPVVVTDINAQFARERVYWEAQMIDEWDGGAYPGADPFEEGSSVLAGAKVIQRMKLLTEYRWAFGLDDTLMALGYAGPVVLGVNWTNDMFDPDADGLLHATGGVAGGHCILANGVSVKRRLVRLHNSWGPDWGIDGHAFISWDDLGALLDDAGEACVPIGRHLGTIQP